MTTPRHTSIWIAVRSVLWTVLLPGVVAGYVPWRFFGLRAVVLAPIDPRRVGGLVVIGGGVLLLATCVWYFARSGRGTLAPIDAPRHLVGQGPYQYVRNPMYLSVTAILLGEVLLTGSRSLLAYWAIWFAAVNVFVIAYEEPTLRRKFGASYELYCQAVRRWIPSVASRKTSG
jgi:protein-S-isoprenylcysteine O-methyltransferase Ste14